MRRFDWPHDNSVNSTVVMDVDLHADLARLGEVASKVAMMRTSAEKVLEDICSSTTGFLAEVSSSIKNVDAAWQAARNHVPDNARAAIVSDFVKFLTESLDVRNTAGLSQLAQAFVDHDTATVDAFIANSINVVVFAKAAAAVAVKHEDTTIVPSTPDDRSIRLPENVALVTKTPEPAVKRPRASLEAERTVVDEIEPKRRRLTLLEPNNDDIRPLLSAEAATSLIPSSSIHSKTHDVESFASALDRSLGKAFANKWLRVVAREPWTDWSNAFVPFLPGHSPGQVALNGELQAFFIVHGRAMWERYFYLGTSLDPRNTMPSKRFRRLRASFGELVQSLYALEGVDVFLFLETYPHPFWPSIVQHPIPLDTSFPSHSRALLSYFQDQCTKRWPSYQGYWAPPVEATTSPSHEYGFETFEPMACLDWMGKSSSQDKWISPNFVAKLVAEMAAKRPTFDAAQSPYVSVIQPAKALPKHWRFPRPPQSKYTWDSTTRRVIDMPPPPVADRTPVKLPRRMSVTPSKLQSLQRK
ncbi:hypothetical protein H257_01039 [Aphanomyces astaci]|uniref:Uncharacterized protein n=1 Tax=Aphanomyces astaci TaxID=112090 RepID=W4H875_APHAT|nr:hypothetical protein H257_01039 [Aphanomyces astaci]ETV87489.1 hypothetical protein H257_01039 [Aphanomyces astaci]|eukprot:XP_009822352.1 hypothetical protein H257_01039 [Aphanomyces astaci]